MTRFHPPEPSDDSPAPGGFPPVACAPCAATDMRTVASNQSTRRSSAISGERDQNSSLLAAGIEARLQPVPGWRRRDGSTCAVPMSMLGYLRTDHPRVLMPPVERRHDTGDIVAIDRDGYLSIKGSAPRRRAPRCRATAARRRTDRGRSLGLLTAPAADRSNPAAVDNNTAAGKRRAEGADSTMARKLPAPAGSRAQRHR
jgi:hypothetical protein